MYYNNNCKDGEEMKKKKKKLSKETQVKLIIARLAFLTALIELVNTILTIVSK